MEKPAVFLLVLAALVFASFQCPAAERDAAIAEGRYIAETSGCNDCHTRGYMPSAGNIPEQQWLTGDVLGWSGPWGTTYAVNLRLFMQGLSEDAWVGFARNLRARFPMPWWGLRGMKEQDLRAIYRYIRSLGPAGKEAPAYLPPGSKPEAPYFLFVPPEK
jgi:mono/diheme cytochrome c family protein